MMDQAIIDKICAGIYVKHPEMRGVKPKISKRDDNHFLMLFKQTKKTSTGMDLTEIVRVTVDEQGKVLKTSSSRG